MIPSSCVFACEVAEPLPTPAGPVIKTTAACPARATVMRAASRAASSCALPTHGFAPAAYVRTDTIMLSVPDASAERPVAGRAEEDGRRRRSAAAGPTTRFTRTRTRYRAGVWPGAVRPPALARKGGPLAIEAPASCCTRTPRALLGCGTDMAAAGDVQHAIPQKTASDQPLRTRASDGNRTRVLSLRSALRRRTRGHPRAGGRSARRRPRAAPYG